MPDANPGSVPPDRPPGGSVRPQRIFVRRLLCFLGPLLILLAGVEIILWKTRETWPVSKVIEFQRAHPDSRFLRGVLDQAFYRYKLMNIERRQPRILVLGSSRVMQFRAEMFSPRESEFYNAGGMIQEIDDLRGFLESAENLPEVVIVGLDLWWFNAARKAPGGLTRAAAFEAATDWQAHLKAIRRLKSRKVIRPAWNAFSRSSDHIGVEARATGMGFRWDGSIQYSVPVPKDWSSWTFVDRERPPVVERILGEDGVFVPCPGISREQISVLDDCLDRLSAKGVLVLGFLPPFSSEAAALLASSPGQSNLWNEAHVQLAQAFERKGQPFVDASLTAKLGLDDRHLIDGMHPGETFHLHLLLKFLEDPRVQSRFSSSRERLAALARAPETNPWYPRYPGQAGD